MCHCTVNVILRISAKLFSNKKGIDIIFYNVNVAKRHINTIILGLGALNDPTEKIYSVSNHRKEFQTAITCIAYFTAMLVILFSFLCFTSEIFEFPNTFTTQ